MQPPFDDALAHIAHSHGHADYAAIEPTHQHDQTQSGLDLNSPITDPHPTLLTSDLLAHESSLGFGEHPPTTANHGLGHTDVLNLNDDRAWGQESATWNPSLDYPSFDHGGVSPFRDSSIHGHDSHTLESTHDSHLTSSLEFLANSTSSHSLETHSSACSSPIHPGDDNSVKIYDDGDVYWHRYGGGKVGTVSGHKYYDCSGNLLGTLKSNLEVVNANGHVLGYVTPGGCAYAGTGNDATLFASGLSARWAAATLIFNLSRA
ncbi:hypothetical protein H6G51_05535 [Limnothrix sp. FACHB-708]|uniref:hypothetical protein n=1 Tax=unclassified Limnothrix TaxID=2632864 RepID=UPI0016893A41|nr:MULTISPECIES: hypothetical protein [unclassified Limnothrix]MBD2552733.1 hypothetical protein [Limnothrix sp. FACHB-708]MBD2590003.1 hypothetical protein [Limnothrix sp. FACHB-406]